MCVRPSRGSAGPLLPGSESPDIGEWREYVEVALRTAVLGSGEVDLVLAHADAHPYDEQVQQHLVEVLAPGRPAALGRPGPRAPGGVGLSVATRP